MRHRTAHWHYLPVASVRPRPIYYLLPVDLEMSAPVNLDRLSLGNRQIVQQSTARTLPKPKGRFLMGPIPWDWIQAIGRLPGKALHVALILRHHADMKRSHQTHLSRGQLKELGVLKDAGRRGLAELEKAGLVSVVRHTGRSPVVKILEAPYCPERKEPNG